MCLNPKEVSIRKPFGWIVAKVACRYCWQCIKARQLDYVARGLCEQQVSTWAKYFTLTYRDGEPNAHFLEPKDFQNFMKLARKGAKLRYLATGEYGDRKGRAHFHAIIYGVGIPPLIPEKQNVHIRSWRHGHVYVDEVNRKSLRYVMKYIAKTDAKQKWFTMSKKPILGFDYIQQKAMLHHLEGIMPEGLNYMPPGGDPRENYSFFGAAEREFMKEIYALRPEWYKAEKSQWMQDATRRLDLYLARKEEEFEDTETFMKNFAEELQKRAAPSWCEKKGLTSYKDMLQYFEHGDALEAEKWLEEKVNAKLARQRKLFPKKIENKKRAARSEIGQRRRIILSD